MIKLTETYTDYFGTERKEDFFFNLTQAELTEWELGYSGGLSAMLKKIIDTKDVPAIAECFKTLLLKSYGEISPDGKRFIKDEANTTAFTQTEAYSQIYIRLLDASEAVNFIKGVIPANLAEKISEADIQKQLADVSSLNK